MACALLLFDRTMITAQEAQEVDQPELIESCEQQSPSPGERERIRGYPVRERQIGTPIDVEWDLDQSFPKRDSVLELIWRALASQPP